MGTDVSEFNRRLYGKAAIADVYRWQPFLLPCEKAVLDRIAGEIRGGRILDVGVGGGRTTPFLRELSEDYLGIDYSEEMVRLARERTPGADFRVRDARDLAELPGGAFDLAFFSFNGIDSVSHADRLRILGALRRVLRPGGWLSFSTHNLDGPWRRGRGLNLPRLRGSPGEIFQELKRFGLDLANYRRHRTLETAGEGYAIVNDCAHNFSLLNYYVTLEAQRRQLLEAGYADILCFSEQGEEVTRDGRSLWLQFLARKSGAEGESGTSPDISPNTA